VQGCVCWQRQGCECRGVFVGSVKGVSAGVCCWQRQGCACIGVFVGSVKGVSAGVCLLAASKV